MAMLKFRFQTVRIFTDRIFRPIPETSTDTIYFIIHKLTAGPYSKSNPIEKRPVFSFEC